MKRSALPLRPFPAARPGLGAIVLGCLSLLLAGCSGSDGASGDARTGGPFEVLKTEPANNGQLFLNQPIRWTFSNPVDVSTASFNSIAFSVSDAGGNPVSEQVAGTFRNGLDANGLEDKYVLEFVPKLPTNDTYTDGGFRPGRIYTATIVRTVHPQDPVIRDKRGQSLWEFSPHQSLRFRTASGNTPGELFLDTKIGGPRVMTWEVGPKVGNRVSLNRLGTAPVEVVLHLDQPLNPSSQNVPVGQDPSPEKDRARSKGRIYIEYDDPVLGDRRWIRSVVEIPHNDATGSTVVLRPDAILPNNATVRVIVEAELEHIAGESNVKDASYERLVGSFQTETAFESQFDAVTFQFKNSSMLDETAAFNDPVAELEQGLLKASFDFEGIQTGFNWAPTSREVVLDTNFQQIQPTNGPPIAVAGGIFALNDITIKKDIFVKAKGTNPLVFLANGEVRIDGRLAVDGGDGDDVHTLNSANFPTAGGTAGPTGGNGGKASQDVTKSTQAGETGFGAGQIPGGGGTGGGIACGSTGTNAIGGGGGGGSNASKGDPDFPASGFTQKLGDGGNGSGTNGGKAGPIIFKDEFDDNDFWGRLVKDDGTVVVGELTSASAGGAGGGGGGDQTPASSCQAGNNFVNDRKGGGGGGGAGTLIIKALGPIIVSETGWISADGGRGGGGEWAGSSTYGGGGGAGAGGMVVLMSASRIDLHTHGGTFAGGDYEFSVSADGNISRVSSYSTVRTKKYVGLTSNKNNAGGYGGMGIVQLMTPPGTDSDNTGTTLDDNIRVINGTAILTGAQKTSYLVKGDVRPDPYFLPVTYGRFSSAETKWVSTLYSERRENVAPQSAGPRVIDSKLGKAGPEWFFSGLSTTGSNKGWLVTDPTSGALVFPAEKLVGGGTRAQISSFQSHAADYYGVKAHVVKLSASVLPDPKTGGWSYSNYRARVYNGTELLGEYRVLTHTEDEIWLEAGANPMHPDSSSLEIAAKFVSVETQGVEGLGETYEVIQGVNKYRYPIANVQVGFAFHDDPSNPNVQGSKDLNRFPQEIGDFLFDLDLNNTALREQLRNLHYRFAKVRFRFNLNYNPENPDITPGPNPVQPGVERPGIRFVVLPYRF
ncbi:MAG: Ig-like domain-containing protein [Planctomycetota bacterium]